MDLHVIILEIDFNTNEKMVQFKNYWKIFRSLIYSNECFVVKVNAQNSKNQKL